jgi:polyisoprenoid-binding protein YceI
MFKRLIPIAILIFVFGAGAIFLLDRILFAPVEVGGNVPAAPTLDRANVSQPQPSDTPAETQVTEAVQPSGNDTRLYQVDASQSEVHYEVGETFFQDNRFATAVGRTQGVAGELLVDFSEPANSQVGETVIDVSQFTSDESRRDNYIRQNGLESARYPQAVFVPSLIEGLPDSVSIGDQVSFSIYGDLTIKNVTRSVVWQVALTVGEGRLVGSAETEILMSDFGVGPIQIAFLRTEDQVRLTFDFVALEI